MRAVIDCHNNCMWIPTQRQWVQLDKDDDQHLTIPCATFPEYLLEGRPTQSYREVTSYVANVSDPVPTDTPMDEVKALKTLLRTRKSVSDLSSRQTEIEVLSQEHLQILYQIPGLRVYQNNARFVLMSYRPKYFRAHGTAALKDIRE